MTPYNGSEFQNEKGTQGSLLKWIWGKIYTKFTDVTAAIGEALSNYYTKSEVDTQLSTLQTTLQISIDAKTTSAEVATQIQSAIDALVNGAPTALDTLKELADALAANDATDNSTLNALNALITTVDGKASIAYVDETFTTKAKTNELAATTKEAIKQVIKHVYKSFLFGFMRMHISSFSKVNDYVYDLGLVFSKGNDNVSNIVSVTVNGLSLRVLEYDAADLSLLTNFASTGKDANKYDAVIANKPDYSQQRLIFNEQVVSANDIATAIVTTGMSYNIDDNMLNGMLVGFDKLENNQLAGLGGYAA